jgi:hypothetical protein
MDLKVGSMVAGCELGNDHSGSIEAANVSASWANCQLLKSLQHAVRIWAGYVTTMNWRIEGFFWKLCTEELLCRTGCKWEDDIKNGTGIVWQIGLDLTRPLSSCCELVNALIYHHCKDCRNNVMSNSSNVLVRRTSELWRIGLDSWPLALEKVSTTFFRSCRLLLIR